VSAKDGGSGQTPGTERLDGRALRTERSRQAVLDAIFDLLSEGKVKPGAAEIAARADVSERTVFRLFEDLDQLFFAAAERQTQRTWHLYLTDPPTGSLAERVRLLVEHRAELYEQIAPVRRAALKYEPFHSEIHRRINRATRLLRRQLLETFAVERGVVRDSDRAVLEAALAVVTSFSAWDDLRSNQRLSVPRAREVMILSLTALLADLDRQLHDPRDG
jgi:TetR/AcrR family transcriptional regulator, regulator of autoinduction and epiphytic fitness